MICTRSGIAEKRSFISLISLTVDLHGFPTMFPALQIWKLRQHRLSRPTLPQASLREELQTLRKEHAERVQALQGSQLKSESVGESQG